MCTLSWWWRKGVLDLWFNRDEQHARPTAEPPRQQRNGITWMAPRDPQGGGTWLMANAAGVVVALLNDYQAPVPETASSRGLIPLACVEAGCISEVRERIEALTLQHYAGFHLLAFQDGLRWRWTWDGSHLKSGRLTENPGMTTSSSVSPESIIAARQRRFARMCEGGNPDWQRAFHHCETPEDPAEGPLMQREDARTVSLCQVCTHGDAIEMAYAERPRSAPPLPPQHHKIPRLR